MKFFLNYLFAAVFVLGSSGLKAQKKEISFEHGNWAEVLARSKKENKLIYLDCYTTWCGPCKWMAKNVFTNDTVADFYNANFVNVEIDMEKGEGIELAKKYGIRAYPTMLYLNSDGEVMHRSCGSSPVASFINTGKDALDPNRQLAANTKKFNNGNATGAFAESYLVMLESGCQDYKAELTAYLSTQKESELTSRTNWNIIYKYVNDYSSKEFMILEKNRDAFSKLYTKDSVQDKINHVYTSGLYIAINKKDDGAFQSLKEKVKASGNPDAEMVIMDADLRYYMSKKDWKNYAATASGYADKYIKDNAMGLNGIAWNFYENVDDVAMMEKAAAWAKHSVELQSIYANNDTYAAVLYKLGKKEEAKKVAEKAIELAKVSGDDYSETAALLKKIEKMKDPASH
ncbi:MAG: thiol:disulfide interchange protein [Bacteroidetes bacterium]|nr:thiol:disulfide interchange protein [Bacteroidota bacterium]